MSWSSMTHPLNNLHDFWLEGTSRRVLVLMPRRAQSYGVAFGALLLFITWRWSTWEPNMLPSLIVFDACLFILEPVQVCSTGFNQTKQQCRSTVPCKAGHFDFPETFLNVWIEMGKIGVVPARLWRLLAGQDLDACLWSPEMYQLSSSPSEYSSKRGGVAAGRDTEAWRHFVGCGAGSVVS